MPCERFYLETPLETGQTYTLTDSEHHHLAHVMRGKEGDRIEMINGMGALAECTVVAVSKRDSKIITESVTLVPLPHKQITLIQAVPRMNRLDTIVEKGTELGMTRLLLWHSAKSERKALKEQQLIRLRHVAIAATKQCGRLYLPEIKILDGFDAKQPFTSATFFGDTDEGAPRLMSIYQKQEAVTFIIGPEGGLMDKEEALLRSLGAIGVKLHDNILRTDTAGIAALAILSHLT